MELEQRLYHYFGRSEPRSKEAARIFRCCDNAPGVSFVPSYSIGRQPAISRSSIIHGPDVKDSARLVQRSLLRHSRRR